MKKLILLVVMVVFSCWVFVLNAQAQCTPPDFPGCTDGVEIGQFEGYLRADMGEDMANESHIFDLDCVSSLVVVGFAKEGHCENPLCSPEGGAGEPDQCSQHQDLENFDVYLDGFKIGYYTDDGGTLENAWFPAGPWGTTADAGNHELTFTHQEYSSSDPESVHYKVSLCAECEDDYEEGCTPGYWKQEQHFGSWTSHVPDGDNATSFFDAFGCSIDIMGKESGKGKPTENTEPTLLQALAANGGGCNALARHAVAALLNAASSGVSYSLTAGEIIAQVCPAIDNGCDESVKDTLASENELGCPLGLAPPSSTTTIAPPDNELLPSVDTDQDGVIDDDDNCPEIANGPDGGTCVSPKNSNKDGKACSKQNCGCSGFCSMDQEDTDKNGIGDVCEPTP